MNVLLFLVSFISCATSPLHAMEITSTQWSQPSSLQKFVQDIQKQDREEKEYEYSQYKFALHLDSGKPDKYCAQWYQERRLEREIATQDIMTAAELFEKHSLAGRNAIKLYAQNDLQRTILRVMELSPELQIPILAKQFPGDHTDKALKTFYELPLHDAFVRLGWAKQYAKRTYNTIDVSTWFLLDTPEQRHETLALWKTAWQKASSPTLSDISYTISSAQQLAIIRSLPVEIKTHPHIKSLDCNRSYELHEQIDDIIKPIKNSSLSSFGTATMLAGIYGIACSCLLKKDINLLLNKKIFLATTCMSLSNFGYLGYLISPALISHYGLIKTASCAITTGLLSYINLYNPNNSSIVDIMSVATFAHSIMILGGVFDNRNNSTEQPQPPVITKPLNEI